MSSKPLSVDPIFEHIPVAYNPKGGVITHIKVQNGTMFIALRQNQNKSYVVQHVMLHNGKYTDIKLELSPNDSFSNLFLDFTGTHCIVTTANGDNYYINSKSLKAFPMKRTKGTVITAVGWNLEIGTDLETGFIVIGTSTGSLYETNINNFGVVSYFKLLKESMARNRSLSITDVFLTMAPAGSRDKWVCFVCLPGHLYILTTLLNTSQAIQQHGSFISTFSETQNVLAPMFASTDLPRHRYVEQGPKSCSGFTLGPIEPGILPSRYAWVNEDGISIGSVDLTSDVDGFDLIQEGKLLKHGRVNGLTEYPVVAEMTEFHVMVLYKHKMIAYSAYNYKQFFNRDLQQDGLKNCGLSRDAMSHLIWMFDEQTIWKYRPNKEKRFVWKVFMENKDFSKAKELTKTMDDQKPFQLVVSREAKALFDEKRYMEAVKCYFECRHPFDSVVLMFMQQQDTAKRSALKLYLMMKLESDTDPVRRTLLVLWIMEIYLSELSDLRRPSIEEENAPTGVMSQAEKTGKNLRDKLTAFMKKESIANVLADNKDAVYRLVLSHMDYETHIQLSTLLRDFETLVRIHLLQNNFKEALDVIKDSGRTKLLYKFATDLLPQVPREFLRVLMENKRVLDSEKLLPAFYKVMGNHDLVAVAFQYFSDIVTSQKASPPIHSFLILLYAENRPKSLLDHLKKFGTERDALPYDPGNALRLCIRKKLDDCCVFLYRIESMYESAVKLALQMDIELAKECAKDLSNAKDLSFDEVESSDDVSKHVWLTIARHMIEKNYDTKAVLELINESENIVSVGDLLPLFPEFTDIEALKEPLCSCLSDTSKNIRDLQRQIKEAGEVMDALKIDLEERKRRVIKAKANDKCSTCADLIMKRPFVMFSCGHFLHMNCFEDYMGRQFERTRATKFDYLRREYKKLQNQYARDESHVTKGKIKVLKGLIEDMLGKDCPLCGTLAVELIDKPFFTPEEYKVEMSKWNI